VTYPSPNEERAPSGHKRRSDSGTVYRDRRRSPADKEAAQLARELGRLAEEFSRFRAALFRLQHHVLVQVRSTGWKCQTVLSHIRAEPVLVEEIVEDTDLDKQSVHEALEILAGKRAAERCNRDGGNITIRRDGKPAERVYWRRI